MAGRRDRRGRDDPVPSIGQQSRHLKIVSFPPMDKCTPHPRSYPFPAHAVPCLNYQYQLGPYMASPSNFPGGIKFYRLSPRYTLERLLVVGVRGWNLWAADRIWDDY